MKSDIEIAREIKLLPIEKIAEKIGLNPENMEFYGKYKAKVEQKFINGLKNNKDGKLILVTAINPTPAGEGKTTTTICLGDALSKIGKKTIIALREPSLGPCFGMKGGATGAGLSQVVPMDEINLHFTGDIHAISAAHDLISSMVDNHIYHGNELNIDTNKVVWKRVVDLNDRALRNIIIGLNGNGKIREDGYMITVASEIMAILCLSSNIQDLKKKVSQIIVAYNNNGEPVRVADIKAQGAVAALLKDAIKPNLVQTLEGNPALIHGGPFANIAHGCNSIIATKTALKLADYVVTEAGFGADLGAEKFLDIKCRKAGLKPSAVVLVATIRALKYNGGVKVVDLMVENIDALVKGVANLERHIENIKKYKLPVVVALNKFASDTDAEIEILTKTCERLGVKFAISEGWAKGGTGGINLANSVLEAIEKEENNFKFLYSDDDTLENKINIIAKEIYRAEDVIFTKEAKKQLKKIAEMGYENLPICIAKTQYSFSDDKNLLGAPTGFKITINEARVSVGAGFVVCIAGDIMTMPGLPKVPSAENIDVNEDGEIVGLF